MSKHHWTLGAVLSLLLMAAPALAQQPIAKPHGHVIGMVATETGPIIAADVTLQTADTVVVARATTAADGRFLLDNLAFGKYSLRVSYLGYKELVVNNLALTPAAPGVDLGTLKLERRLIAILENVPRRTW